MRTTDLNLWRRYLAAAELLRKRGEPLNQRTMSVELGRNYAAVRKYLRHDRTYAEILGVHITKHHHEADYQEAINDLVNGGVKVTHENIAAILGCDHGTVTRFLTRHPEIRPKPAVRRQKKELPGFVPAWKSGRPFGVNYIHPVSGRMTLASVTLAEYIKLWDEHALQFQHDGTPKPEHLPTREEALAHL